MLDQSIIKNSRKQINQTSTYPMKHDKIIGRQILSAPASSLRWNKDANLAIGQEDGRVAIFKLKS